MSTTSRKRVVKGPSFRVGDVFPTSDPHRVRLARFLVAMQPLVLNGRLLHMMPSEDDRSPADDETVRGLLVQSLSATFEALKAFKSIDRPGGISAQALATAEVADAHARLRAVLKDSKLMDQLREARNQVVDHVDESALTPVLDRIADQRVPVFLGTGKETTEDTALPIIDKLAFGALRDRIPNFDNLVSNRLGEIQSDLWKVAHSVLGDVVSDALATKPDVLSREEHPQSTPGVGRPGFGPS